MHAFTRAQHRVLTVAAAAVVAVLASSSTSYACTNSRATTDDRSSSQSSEKSHSSGKAHETKTTPQAPSNADYSGHGANQHGPYDSTRDGSPSGNGNGKGEANGKPCAGCVGKADNKNPKGQQPGGSDHNAGYECDRNHGIGRSNPAHTGCRTPETGGTGEGTGTTGGSTGGDSTGGDTTGDECTGDMTGSGTAGEGTDCPPAGGDECSSDATTGDTTGVDPVCTPGSGDECTGDMTSGGSAGEGTECPPAGGGTEGAGDGTSGTVVEGTGTETGTTGGTVATPSAPEVQGVKITRKPGTNVLGERATRVLSSALPFTGSHVDELLVGAVLLLVTGVAGVLLGRRREA